MGRSSNDGYLFRTHHFDSKSVQDTIKDFYRKKIKTVWYDDRMWEDWICDDSKEAMAVKCVMVRSAQDHKEDT